jgi:hypothetical protein
VVTASILRPTVLKARSRDKQLYLVDAAKVFQLRSHIAQGLNVRAKVRLGLSLAAGLLGRIFRHPHRSLSLFVVRH